MGLLLGAAAARVVSHLITRATGIVLAAQIGLEELSLVAGMIVFGLLVATVPAFIAYRRPVMAALTSP
jgi:putative ABC transport system permease protein